MPQRSPLAAHASQQLPVACKHRVAACCCVPTVGAKERARAIATRSEKAAKCVPWQRCGSSCAEAARAGSQKGRRTVRAAKRRTCGAAWAPTNWAPPLERPRRFRCCFCFRAPAVQPPGRYLHPHGCAGEAAVGAQGARTAAALVAPRLAHSQLQGCLSFLAARRAASSCDPSTRRWGGEQAGGHSDRRVNGQSLA